MGKFDDELKELSNVLECPVCGEHEFKTFTEVCPVCGWEHDFVQSYNYDEAEYSNHLSVNQTKEWFYLKRRFDPKYKWKASALKDGNPTLNELNRLREVMNQVANKD